MVYEWKFPMPVDAQKAAQDVFNQIVAAIAKNAKVFFISKAR